MERAIRQKQTQEKNEEEWASSVGLCQKHQRQHPYHVKVSPRGLPLASFRMTTVLIMINHSHIPTTTQKCKEEEEEEEKKKKKEKKRLSYVARDLVLLYNLRQS